MAPICVIVRAMTYDDALALAAEVDDPDDYLDVVNDLLQLRWADGSPIVAPR